MALPTVAAPYSLLESRHDRHTRLSAVFVADDDDRREFLLRADVASGTGSVVLFDDLFEAIGRADLIIHNHTQRTAMITSTLAVWGPDSEPSSQLRSIELSLAVWWRLASDRGGPRLDVTGSALAHDPVSQQIVRYGTVRNHEANRFEPAATPHLALAPAP